jgi:hypothetical protein
MDDSERLFSRGRANPTVYGFPIRSSAGDDPDPRRAVDVCAQLGRPAFLVDAEGYECEIIDAAQSSSGAIAYVESRAKELSSGIVDVSIRIHLVNGSDRHDSVDIESYNPFFGCDVRLLEWIDRAAILIYREKHSTYACRFGDVWPPKFVKIEDRWIAKDGILGCIGYREKHVRRLTCPGLDALEPISVGEARRVGLLPPDR